jgi:peptidoglycan hydrolase-like protein with peptidoglycan-binding domain
MEAYNNGAGSSARGRTDPHSAAAKYYARYRGKKLPAAKIRGADHTVLPNNTASIKQFQRFHGLVADGIIGPITRAKMRAVNTTLGR